jgi:glycosyltransferase involved in cell wall biosynthesis
VEERREDDVANKIAIFSFVKNECDFIERFIDHNLLIADELTVIDNGSTDGTVEKLKRYGDRIRLIGDRSGFGHKSRICLKWMLASDADIIVPLDADELVVFDEGEGTPDRDPKKARDYLRSLVVQKNDRFQVKKTYLKSPEDGWWQIGEGNKKFFARQGLVGVDCGFHRGRMESNNDPIESNISHLHYHFRSKEAWEKSTEQKLRARLGPRWNDLEFLRTYRGPSYHCAFEFLRYKITGRWHDVKKNMFDERLGTLE